MEYVIPLVLVLLLVGGFVTFLVLNATRRGQRATRGEEQAGEPPGVGQDHTPLGDTSEHAGEQTEEGRTVGGQDADEKGGTGEPVHSGYEGTSPTGRDTGRESAHVRRSGEAEGTEKLAFPDVEPPRAEREAEQPGARAAGGDEDGPAMAREQRDAEGEREQRDDEGGRRPRDEQAERPASERLADRGF
jgi:hypothetical protein